MAGKKQLKAASASAEDRAVKAVEAVSASKAWERLQEKLQEGGEKLVNKLLNFCECSAAEPGICADSTPYRKNLTKISDLTLPVRGPPWQCLGRAHLQDSASRKRQVPTGLGN